MVFLLNQSETILLQGSPELPGRHAQKTPRRAQGTRWVWTSTKNERNDKMQPDQACFDHLSRETYPKHSVGAKAFGPPNVVARSP